MRRLVALLLLGASTTACLGSSSPPPLDKALIGAYASTVGQVSGAITRAATPIASCVKPSYGCQINIATAGAAAGYLATHLAADQKRATPTLLTPASISTTVTKTIADATSLRKDAADISAHSKRSQVLKVVAEVDALATDVAEWEPTGDAGQVVAANKIFFAPPLAAKLAPKLHVRPLIYIRPDSYFTNFTRSGTHCKGAGYFSGIKVGTAVTIYSNGQKVAGLGYIVRSFIDGDRCGLVADVRGLPLARFYEVQIASRGKLAFSRRDLVTEATYTRFG